MIILYTPPPTAIVPFAPAVTRREAICRRKRIPTWLMPDNYEAQVYVHQSLVRSGWKPARWEVIA
jgi:hypothetical protein